MKHKEAYHPFDGDESHPARGAWIETRCHFQEKRNTLSHPARGAWIETMKMIHARNSHTSHPARGAWIET